MTPEQLSDVFVAALTDLVSEGAVDLPDGVPSQVLVERPKVKEHGDYATNVALQLGKRAGLNPRDLATMLAERLTEHPGSRRSRSPVRIPQRPGRRRSPGCGRGRRRARR